MTDEDKYPFPGPSPDGTLSEEDGDVIEEYAHSCRIVREDEPGNKRSHYEGPMGRVKSFDNPDKARSYADVQTVWLPRGAANVASHRQSLALAKTC